MKEIKFRAWDKISKYLFVPHSIDFYNKKIMEVRGKNINNEFLLRKHLFKDIELMQYIGLQKGCVITSRGCRNRCWFCSVWKREGDIRELKIKEGNNILDDNLLACSDNHIQEVFNMLKRQKGKRQFTGGLEAAILKEWHVKELNKIKPYQIFFAYDTPHDKEPLFEAGKLLKKYGFKNQLRCYCLIGWEKDTFEKAENRLWECMKAGFLPMAMLYIDESGNYNHRWKNFQREWSRPAIIRRKFKEITYEGNKTVTNIFTPFMPTPYASNSPNFL